MKPIPCVHRENAGKEGIILFIVLGGIAMLTLIGLTTMAVLRTDFRISRNHRDMVTALYDAEGGANYVKQRIEQRLTAGQSFNSIMANLNVQPPAGFFFDTVTELRQLSDSDLYAYTVVGRAGPPGTPGHLARSSIEVAVRQDQALTIGIFGVDSLTIRPNKNIYSYDSRVTPNPTASGSTGQASLGSNSQIAMSPNVNLDGTVALGANSAGTPAFCGGCSGYNTQDMGHINPDPLGANGGSLADRFSHIATNNDNHKTPRINASNYLQVNNNQTATLTAGNYYITGARVQGTLNIDPTDGPVNIYLTGAGEFRTWPNSRINLNGNPSDFRIYSRGSGDIFLLPNIGFRGFIYAPNASVRFQPNATIWGGVWAKEVTLQPNADIFIDTSILNAYKSTRLTFASWKETR